MAQLKHIFRGESLTVLLTFPEAYDMARIEKHEIYIGTKAFTGVVSGQSIELKLTSEQTDVMYGRQEIRLWLDDSVLGVKKPYCGEIIVSNSNAKPANDSTSSVSDIIIPIVISETAITVGDVMYNYVKGDKGDPFTYSDFTPEQKAELQQPATEAIASIQEVELAVEQAEGLRQQAELNRQTNTATAIQNAEQATDDANDAAILANEKAGLADQKATLADQKATLANDAATLANTKAGLADTAATNANNVANGYAAELAAKELKANKQNSLAADGTGTKFPTVDAVNALGSGFRQLAVARGAIYNATTGYYELNGLTNITEEQMMNIFIYTSAVVNTNNWSELFAGKIPIRTTYQVVGTLGGGYGSKTYNYAFQGNSFIETYIQPIQPTLYIGNALSMFRECTSLHTINYLYLTSATASNYTDMFKECSALVTCNIKNIKATISIGWSPLLSLASLQYLIAYRANGTTPITITVHPTVFAKLTDNTNYPTWYAVNQDALTKYITFASA